MVPPAGVHNRWPARKMPRTSLVSFQKIQWSSSYAVAGGWVQGQGVEGTVGGHRTRERNSRIKKTW